MQDAFRIPSRVIATQYTFEPIALKYLESKANARITPIFGLNGCCDFSRDTRTRVSLTSLL